MKFVVAGLNHKTAPIAVREVIARNAVDAKSWLASSSIKPLLPETVILSTCNRFEIYGATECPERALHLLTQDFFFPFCQTTKQSLLDLVYTKTGVDAVHHLFSVAASADSQIVGETQITGQVKTAYQQALSAASSGATLNPLFERALFVAKRVKTETDLGRGNVSVGSVAIKLAGKIFEDLASKQVLLIGAGEIGEQVIRHLAGTGATAIMVNRSDSRVLPLVAEGLGTNKPWDQLVPALVGADIVITSLSTQVPELSLQNIKSVLQQRLQRPLFLIDLGVPRNIVPEAASLDNLYLYNLDDLSVLAQAGLKERTESLAQAKIIIDEEARVFYETSQKSGALPALGLLGQKLEDIRQAELQRTLSKMTHLSANDVSQIETLTRAIVQGVLREPALSLKNQEHNASEAVSFLKKLFRLDDEGH